PVVPGTTQSNALAAQLQTVARVIGGRSALGAKRQVFFVSIGGFDTHDAQKVNQGNLMTRIGQAVEYFDRLLASPAVNALNEVTLFTASDFGRTLTSNGDGTDHGWGAHHFVSGGAVRGGDLYGRFPSTAADNDDYVGNGRLLPELSVDQYGATLARWFGRTGSELDLVVPSLANFPSRGLGSMGAEARRSRITLRPDTGGTHAHREGRARHRRRIRHGSRHREKAREGRLPHRRALLLRQGGSAREGARRRGRDGLEPVQRRHPAPRRSRH